MRVAGRSRNSADAVELIGKQLLAERHRQAPVAEHGARIMLPAANGERARLGLQIEIVVGIAQRRQPVRNFARLLGDEILMLDDGDRQLHSGELAELPRPQARGVDDDVAGDVAAIGLHRLDAAIRHRKSSDRCALDDAHAAGARAFRIGLRQRIGIDMAVRLDPGRTAQARRIEQRKEPPCFVGTDELHGEAVASRRRRGALQFLPARIAAGEPEAADIFPADVLSGLGADPAAELGAILHEPRQISSCCAAGPSGPRRAMSSPPLARASR